MTNPICGPMRAFTAVNASSFRKNLAYPLKGCKAAIYSNALPRSHSTFPPTSFSLSPPELPAMHISFLAQSQPHIAAVALRLATRDKGELTIIAEPDGIQLELKPPDGSTNTRFPDVPLSGRPLPSRQTVRLDHDDGTYEVKVPIESREVGLDVLKVPVGAGELAARGVRRARCKRCGNLVWDVRTSSNDDGESTNHDSTPRTKIARQVSTAPTRKPYTFRALPSAHWHESSEAWLCHPSGEFTTKLQSYVEKGWWPRWRVGLVGERAVAVRVEYRNREGMVSFFIYILYFCVFPSGVWYGPLWSVVGPVLEIVGWLAG